MYEGYGIYSLLMVRNSLHMHLHLLPQTQDETGKAILLAEHTLGIVPNQISTFPSTKSSSDDSEIFGR